jgi:hypothetical protein
MQSCADCHSYETRWPWYARLAPVSFQVAQDVRRAREKLNFSEWPRNPTDELEAIYFMVDQRSMPPKRYQWMHPRSRLAEADRELLKSWASGHTLPDRISSDK